MSKKLSIITLICFAVGIVLGLIVPNIMTSISFLGTIYVNLLKVMIVPVLFTSIICSLINSNQKTSRITIKTVVLFIIMFIISFVICLGLWAIIKPGQGFIFDVIPWDGEILAVNIGDFFVNLVPNNVVQAMATNAILPVILFAFFFGIVYNKVAKTSEATKSSLNKLRDVLNGLNAVFLKMLHYIMYITPVGVLALVGNMVATMGPKIIGSAVIYIACAYLGCIVIAILVMILPVWIYCKISPITYIKKVYKIWLITLSTCSSAATLPNTIKVCNEEFGVPNEITNLVVPLGCTIHMCGGAVSFSLLAMVNLQMFGIPLTAGLFITMLVIALLLNMGAPGIPGGGIVIGATYLATLGLPLTFIGFYAGIYRVLDMAYTTMNVCGDISANLLINENEKHIQDKSDGSNA